jgi:hypothetical protein
MYYKIWNVGSRRFLSSGVLSNAIVQDQMQKKLLNLLFGRSLGSLVNSE